MTQLELVASLLSKKLERQTLLKEKSKELDELKLDLYGSRFVRMFGSTYLVVKRFLTLAIGVMLILFASILSFAPELLLQHKEFKSLLLEQSKEYYKEMVGLTFKQTLLQFAQNNSMVGVNDIAANVDFAFSRALEEKIKQSIKFLAVLLFMLAAILLYISRLTSKMRIRNRKISQVETLARDIISNYKQTIEEEEKELQSLNEIFKGSLPQQE